MLRRRLLRILLIGMTPAVLGGLVLLALAWTPMGAAPDGPRLTRIEKSSQWKEGSFFNRDPRIDGPIVEMMNEWFFGGSEHRWPAEPIQPEELTKSSFDTKPASGLRITWLGHSAMLLEIDGRRVLIDPVWGQRASPLSFLGPSRFYEPPLPLDQIPDVDAIVISHDHSTVLFAGTKWWPDVPGESFGQAPCPSSGMEKLNRDAFAPKGPCHVQTASIER